MASKYLVFISFAIEDKWARDQGCPVIATGDSRNLLRRHEIRAVWRPDDIFREGSDSGRDRRTGPVDQNGACWLVALSSLS